jgi:hypothetical protein
VRLGYVNISLGQGRYYVGIMSDFSVRVAAGLALLCVASGPAAAASAISGGIDQESPYAAAPLGITPNPASPINTTGLGPVGDVFEGIPDGVRHRLGAQA